MFINFLCLLNQKDFETFFLLARRAAAVLKTGFREGLHDDGQNLNFQRRDVLSESQGVGDCYRFRRLRPC